MRKDEASLLALWLESVLHGVYTVLFFTCIYILCYLRDPRTTSKTVLGAVGIMYSVATAHVAIILRRALLAFIYSNEGGSQGFYDEVSQPLNVAQQTLFIINGIIADCLLIYRCYIVWRGRLWVCAIPALLLLLSAGSGFLFTREYALVSPGGTAWTPSIQSCVTTFTAATLATNLLVTILIASRIWWVTTRTSRILGQETCPGGKYKAAIFGVIESGVIYCIPVIFFLVIYETQSGALPILCQILTQIAGIAPTLIVVQAGLGLTVDKTHSVGSNSTAVDPQIALAALRLPFPVLSITKTRSPQSPVRRVSFGTRDRQRPTPPLTAKSQLVDDDAI